MAQRVGVIGMGTMGASMALNLLKGGFEVTVFNRTRERTRRAADAGAKVAGSVAHLVRASEAVVVMLANDAAVREVVTGAGGIAESCRAGQVVIDSSTVHPDTNRAAAAALAAKGVAYLDAPVTGSRPQAEAGQLQFIVSGERAAFDSCAPIFEAMGKRRVYVGPTGAAACVKLAGNTMGAIHMLALAEAMSLVRRCGVDPAVFLDVVLNSGARSVVAEFKGPKLLRDDFSPDFSLALMNKDVGLAGELAAGVGHAMPMLAEARRMYAEAAKTAGGLDMCAVYKVFADVRKPAYAAARDGARI